MARRKSAPAKSMPLSSNGWDYIPKKRRNKRRQSFRPMLFKVLTTVSEDARQFHVGQTYVGTTNNLIPTSWNECRAEFRHSEEEGGDSLILYFDNGTVVINLILDLAFVKNLITSRVFCIEVTQKDEAAYFDLYFAKLPLTKFNKTIALCIQNVFTIIYKIFDDNIPESADQEKSEEDHVEEIVQLYKSVKKVREESLELGLSNVQHPRLKPELRPYQANAVKWMLLKENQAYDSIELLHPLYTPVTLKSGKEIFYNKYTGYVDLTKPLIENPMKGGILADEMGLGKTVEVLACILMHPKFSSPPDHASDLEKTPRIEKIPKSLKRPPKSTPEDNICEPKKIKIPDDWVKGKGRKSANLIAARMWYESRLQEVTIKPRLSQPKTLVQCVCGFSSEEGTVTCVNCGKVQHKSCLGYRDTLGDYKCPQCWLNEPLLESKATLIVSPISLRTQWSKEICKHVRGSFNVLQYEGSSVTPVYPTQLQEYDVVITTYNVLLADLKLTEGETEVTFRHRRRFSPPGSPITRIKWWRLCLDEAQIVETGTSMVSAMAHKLNAYYRWAVTGTPISKGISDLYGLVNYLQLSPYDDQTTWKHKLFDPYTRGDFFPMHNFLSQVMWRSAKDEIINQINIPKQTVEEHWLTFSAVEQYFYKCEHQLSRDAFLEKVKSVDPDASLRSLDKRTLKTILGPLLSLRHVCSYPNSVRTRYLATKKPVKSMKDLLEALIKKNTTESEDYLRLILSCLNGLAGIYLLLESPHMAIEKYREALQLYSRFTEEEKNAKLTIDKLQLVHAMYNLAEILDTNPPGIPRTLRDENLRRDCVELEKKYIEKFINQSMTALQGTLLTSNAIQKLRDSFVLNAGKWYSDMLNWIIICGHTNELFTRIDSNLASGNVQPTFDFRDVKRLLFTIANWDDHIAALRESSIEVVNNLYTHCPDDEFQIIIAQELVQLATDCHLRPQKKNKSRKKCPVCIANDHLKSYEFKLFSMAKRKESFEEMSLKGSWKPTTEELVFKSILQLGRTKSADKHLIKDGEIHINLLENLKKEFKEIRKLWTFLDQQICAQDELDICKIRLRVKEATDDEDSNRLHPVLKNLTYNLENKLETIHVLHEHEVGYQKTLLHNEEIQNRAALEKNLGIKSYLETLHKQQYEGQTPDPCPICKNTLELHYTILPCGHSYCMECIQLLIEQSRGHQLQCSVCRAYHHVGDVSYIKQGGEHQNNEPDGFNIRGNFSTKVEGVIKLIMDLKAEDENVKILLFSYWVSVLNYVKTALTLNNIPNELAATSNLEKQIERFKDPKQDITTLLLPIHLGSKGLNLVEATHVILIEPLLNPGDELQAIGRVHRIGQTRPTVVHKFFIKNTIEESIQKATNTDKETWDKNKITLRQLIDLFVSSESDTANDTQVLE